MVGSRSCGKTSPLTGLFLLLFLFGSKEEASGQQDAIYSQYMFNRAVINPAVAGTKNTFSTVLLHREQWAGMKGAPSTSTFGAHTPIKGRNFALGANAIRTSIGPTKNTGFSGTYAYHLPFSKGKLSLGLSGGAFVSELDGSMLEMRENGDRLEGASKVSEMVPTFDLGSYYYSNTFYAGLSVTHLTQQRLGFNKENGALGGFGLKRHFMASAGRAIVIHRDLILRPSTLIKYVDGAPLNVDLNFSAQFRKTLWAGISYRSNKGGVLILEYNISDYLRAGYSYGLSFSSIKDHHNGTHEAFIGLDLDISGKESISPRYL